MISHEHKCIFIHIPKTAGSSVEKKLGLFDELTWGVQDHRTIRDLQPLTFHLALKLLRLTPGNSSKLSILKNLSLPGSKDKNRLPNQVYKSYYKFTIVRNPWDRAYSWYKNVMRDPRHEIQTCDFRSFIENHGESWALKPQTHWLTDHHGSIAMDAVAKFEDLDRDMTRILRKLGFTDTNLPHILDSSSNSEGDRPYWEAYDSLTKEMIAARYKEEIDIFGYTFR